jgi:undecaprenyl-diphosphatase
MTHPAVDTSLFRDINDFAKDTSWLHGAMADFAKYGIVLFVVLIAVGAWLGWRERSPRTFAAAGWAGAGTLLAVALNQPLVHAFAEKRPYVALQHVEVLISRSSDPGFPSDHATMAGAVAMGLLLANRRLGIVAWVAAVVLAFSRVYVGAHYPQDVLAGLAFGALVSGLGWLLIRRPAQWLVTRVIPGMRTTAERAPQSETSAAPTPSTD